MNRVQVMKGDILSERKPEVFTIQRNRANIPKLTEPTARDCKYSGILFMTKFRCIFACTNPSENSSLN
jgi:hypothetical protein